jgi:ferritin-like metal-binding protein YciE
MDKKELLIEWIKDAHALEMNAAKSLEGFAPDFENLPEAHSAITQHIEETHEQAQRLEEVLEKLGSDNSTLKDISAKAMGFMSGKTNPLSGDKLVKHAIVMHAMESTEHATYAAIERLANLCGESEVEAIAKGFVNDEQEMADWVQKQIPLLVDQVANEE